MDDCYICQKHKTIEDFVIFESSDMIVSHMPATDQNPQVPLGYFFIEPKNHITHLWELTDQQARQIGFWIRQISEIHKKLWGVDKTYFVKFGDEVPHLHVHVYPRHPKTPEHLKGDAVRHWSETPTAGRDTVVKMCQELKAVI